MQAIKRIIPFILSIAIMLTVLPARAYAVAGDEIRASKKIISVVYDDSGSMAKNARWSYTSYAMQALIALLNEQDELYITFMSEPGTARQMSTSDPEGSINMIRGWKYYNNTPVDALDTARAKLDGVNESDPSAQYWLVIITDGEIQGMAGTLQSKLDSYKFNTMHNGTKLNVAYLGMGSASTAAADPANNLYTYMADSAEDIVDTLRKVADLISGRLSPDSVSQSDSRTITVASKLPLYSISILSQQSDARAVSASIASEPLNVQKNLSLDATDLPLGIYIRTLYGNAAVINNRNNAGELQVIPAGTYTIVFSSDIDINDLTIQVEPAISLKAEISRNGAVISDLSKIVPGDKVDVKIIPVVPGTDTVIPDPDLPKQISWTLEHEADGQITGSVTGRELSGVTILPGTNIIRGIINIPGYAPFVREVSFRTEEILTNLDLIVEQPDDPAYMRTKLGDQKFDNSNTVRFIITNNGKPVSKDILLIMGITLDIDNINVTSAQPANIFEAFFGSEGWVDANCELRMNDDGSFSLIPDSPWSCWFLKFFFPNMIRLGDYSVGVSVSTDHSITGEGKFSIIRDPDNIWEFVPPGIPWLIFLLILLLLFYYIFVRKHFPNVTVHCSSYSLKTDGKGEEGTCIFKKLCSWSGIPNPVARITFAGLVFVPVGRGKNTRIKITGKSIKAKYYTCDRSTYDPLDDLESLIDGIKPVEEDEEVLIEDWEVDEDPTYFLSTPSSETVKCIWVTKD